MGQISTSIQLMDNVSSVLANINKSIDTTVAAFEKMDGSTGASFSEARANIAKTSMQIDQLNSDLTKNNAPLKEQNNLWSQMRGKIAGAVSAYAGFQGLKSLIGLSDTVSQTTARLDLMNDGMQSTAELSDKIYESANRSRGSYLDTADAVAKLGTMAGDAFSSNDEIIAFMEQLNKQFTIGGTSIEGQQYAMLQLTQAMGSGALRGEELNSILEQAPNIVQTIADYMDVPKGKIKDLASEGEITAEIVKNAMLESADETNKKFDSMPKTFGQTWMEIKNAAVKSFDGISTQLSEALNSAKVQQMVSSIISALPGAIEVASDFLSVVMDVGQFVVEHWGVIAPIVGGVASAFLAFKAVTSAADAIKKVSDSVETFKNAAGFLKGGGLKGILKFFSLGPVGAIIIGLTALTAAVVLLWNNCEGFRDGVKKVWSVVKNAFITAWTAITDFFTKTIPNAFNAVLGFFKSIPGFFQNLWNTVKDAFVSVWTAILSNPVLGTIVSTIVSVFNGLKNTLVTIWNGIKTVAGGVWNMIKTVILGPILLLIDLVTGNFTKLKEDASLIWNNIKTAASTIWNGIKTIIGGVVSGVVSVVQSIWTGLMGIVRTIFNGIKNTIKSIWNAIKSFVVSAVTTIKNKAVGGFKSMISGIKNTVSRIKATVVAGFEKAIAYIKELPGKAVKWGADFINGLKEGIKDKISSIGDAVAGVADKIRGLLHFSRPDAGPLREYEKWMPDFMKGLSAGISRNKSLVVDQVKDLASRMQAVKLGATYSLNGSMDATRPLPASAVQTMQSTTATTNNQNTKNVYLNVTVTDSADEDRFIAKLQRILEEGEFAGAEGVHL